MTDHAELSFTLAHQDGNLQQLRILKEHLAHVQEERSEAPPTPDPDELRAEVGP